MRYPFLASSLVLASSLAFLTIAAAQAPAQDPQPTQNQPQNQPQNQSDQSLAAPQTQAPVTQDTPLLHLDVRRVPIDLVVVDKQGNPVRGLTQDDFVVNEDKQPQTILSFDYQDGSTLSYVPAKLPPLPANTFVNVPTQPERGPLYILYYDMVNTPMEDQMSAHQQLLDFVDQAQPGARFALFVNAAGLHMILGFTSDHALLHAAILSKGPGPHVPDVFMYGKNYGYTDAGAALLSLKFIADYVNGIPGRKNLIWLSSIFPIPVGATMSGPNTDTGVGGGFSSSTPQINDLTYLLSETIKKTYSAMMRSQVALYPVDLEGQNPENNAADQVVKGQLEDDIASATGGHAYFGNNRLKLLIDKAVENGESYYTLSYAPTNAKYDGLERSIEVKLANAKGHNYTLSYRTLYYAVSDDQVQKLNKKEEVQSRFLAAKAEDTLYANIEHGAPMLHDLLFSAHFAATGSPVMATPAQMLELQDSPAFFRTRHKDRPLKPLTPVKLQKYTIDYGVVDPQLKVEAKRTGSPAILEFAAAAYDADGRLLNSELNDGVASTDTKSDTRPNGKPSATFRAEQQLQVPPGAASIRIAVRDKATNRTGSLEIPLPLKTDNTKQTAAR
jgi:VWFA-related protein